MTTREADLWMTRFEILRKWPFLGNNQGKLAGRLYCTRRRGRRGKYSYEIDERFLGWVEKQKAETSGRTNLQKIPLADVTALASALQHALEAQRHGVHPFDHYAVRASVHGCGDLLLTLEEGGMLPLCRDGKSVTDILKDDEEGTR